MHYAACGAGDVNTIKILHGFGGDVMARDKEGRTRMHDAAGAGNADAVFALNQLGADVNAQNLEGRSPTHSAARMNQVTTPRLLYYT
eukprot:8366432-Pyramimonas_sp.AAC.1